MKKNKLYMLWIAVATLVASCGSDNEATGDGAVSREVNFVMAVRQPQIMTKALLTDEELNGSTTPGISSAWTPNDKVAGYPLFDNGTLITLAKASGGSATNRESFVGSAKTEVILNNQEYSFFYPAQRAGEEATVPLDFSQQSGGELQDLTQTMLVAWAKAKCVEISGKEYHFADINGCDHENTYDSQAKHEETSDVVLFDNKMAIVRFTLVVDKDDEHANQAAGIIGDGKCKPITHVTKVVVTDDNDDSRLMGKVVLNKKTGVVFKNEEEQENSITLEPKAGSSWVGNPLNYSTDKTSLQNKSWGLTFYMAFPCPEYNDTERYKSTLTFKPLITVTTTQVDEHGDVVTDDEGHPVTKDYYCFLKERTLNEGFFYRTTAIHCYAQKIQAQLEIAEWLVGGAFDVTQDNW